MSALPVSYVSAAVAIAEMYFLCREHFRCVLAHATAQFDIVFSDLLEKITAVRQHLHLINSRLTRKKVKVHRFLFPSPSPSLSLIALKG